MRQSAAARRKPPVQANTLPRKEHAKKPRQCLGFYFLHAGADRNRPARCFPVSPPKGRFADMECSFGLCRMNALRCRVFLCRRLNTFLHAFATWHAKTKPFPVKATQNSPKNAKPIHGHTFCPISACLTAPDQPASALKRAIFPFTRFLSGGHINFLSLAIFLRQFFPLYLFSGMICHAFA